MREQIILFVYKKGDELRFVYEQDAKFDHDDLVQQGYKHIDTINAIEWIEHHWKPIGQRTFCQCKKPEYGYLRPVCFKCNKVVSLP